MTPRRAIRRGAERRQTPRADARLSMRLEGERDGDRAHVVTESQNISCSGVYCYSSHYLAPLSKVALTIVLPQMPDRRNGQDLLKCEGIVVRCEGTNSRSPVRQFELACSFLNLEAEQRARLDAFVRWRNLQSLRAATGAPAARPAAKPRSRATAAAPRKTANRKTSRRASS